MRPEQKNIFCKKLIKAVAFIIKTEKMLSLNDSVLIGVSGGPDSVALLDILSVLAGDFNLKLAIAHLNHGLRKTESDKDAEFVISLAKKAGLPCYIKKADVFSYQKNNRLSLEEAARDVRYDFFKDLLKTHAFNKIALGHQANDNAELILMYLLRGSGPLGITGIPPVRDQIIRPLIEIKKNDLLLYLKYKNIQFRIDKSNRDLRHTRNRIRHQLIPDLQKLYNPKIISALNRLGKITRAEDNWQSNIIDDIFKACLLNQSSGKISLSIIKLADIHLAARRRIIRKAIYAIKGDLKQITAGHVEAVCNLITNDRLKSRLNLPGGIIIIRQDRQLFIKAMALAENFINPHWEHHFQLDSLPFSLHFLKEANAWLRFSETRVDNLPDIRKTGPNIAFFDSAKIIFPLKARCLKPGDRFSPLGMRGSQKIKKFFINNKISESARKKAFILHDQERIIWLVGYRIAQSAKITITSKSVLKVEFFLA